MSIYSLAYPTLIPSDINLSSVQSTNSLTFQKTTIASLTTPIVTGLTLPVGYSDATSKIYVDTMDNSISWKNPVRVATTSPINLTVGTLLVIDGLNTYPGDRVLVKNQNSPIENGIYTSSTGHWFRTSDANSIIPATGSFIYVSSGNLNSQTIYTCPTIDMFSESVYFDSGPIYFNLFNSGNTTVPGIPNNSVQFNNNSTFTGSSSFTYTPSSGTGSVLQIIGSVTGLVAPVNPADAANKYYVDTHIGAAPGFPLNSIQYNQNSLFTGSSSFTYTPSTGTGSGSVLQIIGSVTGLVAPVNPADAANKYYVDTHIGAAPGFPANSIQFNQNSLFTGSSNFIWNNTSNILDIVSSIHSTSSTTGSMVISGGIGLSGSMYIDGSMQINSTVQSTNSSTGSLILGSGLGLNGDIHANGNIYASGFFATSDIYMKENIKPIHNSLDIINKIECCTYKLKNQDKLQFGVMAQQLEEIGLGNLVQSSDLHKSVNYIQIITLLINSVQELSNDISAMKNSEKNNKKNNKKNNSFSKNRARTE